MPKAKVVLLPGIPEQGLGGRFIDTLRSLNAETLGDDDAAITSCNIDIFAASSPLHEIKEVLRRALARNLHWDEIEIIATDDNVYACALDSIARRLKIPVSYAVGLPASRTRPGRVVAAYLRWLQEDFSDDIMRSLLEAGDISANGVSLARTLRKLRIGWGRDRYLKHIEAAELEANEEDREASERDEQRRLELLNDLDALKDLFTSILAATPVLKARIAPSAVAEGILAVIEFAVTDHDVDRMAKERLQSKLERIRATMTREVPVESALAVVKERLDIRVPALGSTGPAPWTSTPGHVHLSSLEHGGFTSRKATFIVGLDAGRFPRARFSDPLLTDDDRAHVSTTLSTSAERVAAAQQRFSTMFARLRGDVTLSYSAYDAVEGRKLSPATVVLDAYRIMSGNPAANYEHLRDHTLNTASAVPRNEEALDIDDVWLGAMAEGGVMRAAQHVVRSAFPDLDRGIAARASRDAGPYKGMVSARADLDPRVTGKSVSPSGLETLGTCGLRYFYQYVLEVRPPETAEFDPESWLDPRNRGSLLHKVFEDTLLAARERGVEVLSSEFDTLAFDILAQTCVYWQSRVPAPSDTIYQREVQELKSDVAAFNKMCRDFGANWIALEYKFRTDIDLDGKPLNVKGIVDRIDELENGELLVIDYKTGSPYRYQNGVFEGGKRLQHLIYSLAVEKLMNKRVARMEYRFPTAKAEAHNSPFDGLQLAGGTDLLNALLDQVAAGRFLPTTDRQDCTFCDFRDCCRVTTIKNETHSPMANWARDLSPQPDEMRELVELKGRFR